MKKKLLILLAILVLAGGVGGWLWHSHKNSKPIVPPGVTYVPTATNPPVATKSVTIQNYIFSPADITVKKGSSVTWTNKDIVGYTVTEDDDQTGGPASSVIPQNQMYVFKFNKVGLFHYHDSLDPNITGTVTVSQ